MVVVVVVAVVVVVVVVVAAAAWAAWAGSRALAAQEAPATWVGLARWGGRWHLLDG